ncbi:MAG: hypothetical protein JSR59_12535 [Proteobacteria bacterium]|nr:hypothetical protein [Pseudomonadota bacterium]
MVRAVEPWLIEVQKQRRLVLSGMQEKVDLGAIETAQREARKLIDAGPAGVDVKPALADALKAQEAVRAAAADANAVGGALQAYVDAMLSLRTSALDASQLSLDPEQATYYLMAASTDTVSSVIESVSHSRATSGAIDRGGVATPDQLRRLYAVRSAGVERLATVSDQLGRAAAAEPSVRERLKADDALKTAQAFYAAADAAWFGKSFAGSVQALNGPGQAAVDALRKLSADGTQLLDELLQARIAATERERNEVLAVVVVALALVAYLFYAFFRVMDGGLGEVARHLRAMTDGDLTASPHPWGRDEAAHLMISLSEMQHALRVIVKDVRVASDELVHASGEIASASTDLSQRSEQAAANLEESASAIEQISSTVRQASEHAQEAARCANDNASVADAGGRTIATVVETMQNVQGSSNKIENIIGVIDGIAFQTNILALNAAVEAARAGEQGKGFAVVASEVRALAQRSASAAREIKGLIVASAEQVETGTRVVDEAGRTMQQLVGTAERMRGLLSGISTGATEQSTGIAQIGASVQALDQQTQQNAALVEQTAAAAASLEEQARSLSERVARFRLPA